MTAPASWKESAIAIRGDSVAAWCCAYLLKKAGVKPALERTDRPRLPAIMLSEAALALIRDVFESPNLFLMAHRITRRSVAWGHAEPASFDHAAVVVSESDLLSELEKVVREPAAHLDREADFTIFASRPLPGDPFEHRFGSRTAQAAKIRLKDSNDSASCWIESLEDGWLFLIPDAMNSGWLLSVGCSPAISVTRSRLISRRIESMSEPSGAFAASPRILSPLSGPGWLACGTAGIAFDPLCGDGTAHAIREAILAVAVARAILKGGAAKPLLNHYEARLTAGLQRHLAVTMDFYRSGNCGEWWDQETAFLQQGLEWCAGKLTDYGPFRYQLTGFELRPIDNRPA
jgi:2-polyprenyl-6-methoxyphenol hydroxylase-like FAD-dependent oxidoreductase